MIYAHDYPASELSLISSDFEDEPQEDYEIPDPHPFFGKPSTSRWQLCGNSPELLGVLNHLLYHHEDNIRECAQDGPNAEEVMGRRMWAE